MFDELIGGAGHLMRSGKRDASVVNGFRWQSLRHAQAADPISYGLTNKSATLMQMPDEDSRFDQTGTDADAGLIQEFLKIYGKSSKDWIAGHLIAAAFGGSGSDPRNITPLPKTANRKHAAVEGKIRAAHNQLCEFFSQTVVKRYCDVLWALRYKVIALGVGSRTLNRAAQGLRIRVELCEFSVTRDGDGRPAKLSTSCVPIRADQVEERASQVMRTICERWKQNQSEDTRENSGQTQPRISSLKTAPIVKALKADDTLIAIDINYPNQSQGIPFVSPPIGITPPPISGGVFDSPFSSTEFMDEATNPMDELPFDPNDGGEWTGFKK